MSKESSPSGENKIIGAVKSDFLKLWTRLRHEPTKQEYDRYGRYSMEVVEKYFESFGGLRKLFGEEAPTFTKAFENSIKKSDQALILENYVRDEVAPWIDRYPMSKPSNYKQLIVGADWHDEFMDPFANHVFIETCRERQPDYINLAGDIMDFYELSCFNKNPSRIFKLQEQIDFVTENIFKPLREACPNAQIDYIIGNHEFRLIKFLMSNGQALSSLRCLSLGRLLELDKWKINMVATSPFGQIDDEFSRNYKVYDDLYMVTHGAATNTEHAAKELNKWRIPGCSGHVHHRQKVRALMAVVAQSSTHLNREIDWISLGCMCKLAAGEEYIQDLVRWQQGFNIVHLFLDQKKTINEYIEIKNGIAVVGGKVYVKEK